MQQYNCYSMFWCSLCSCKKTRAVHSNGNRASLSLGNAQKVAQQQHIRAAHTHTSCTASNALFDSFLLRIRQSSYLCHITLVNFMIRTNYEKRTEGWSITEVTHKIIPSTVSCYRMYYPYLHKQTHTYARTRMQSELGTYICVCLCVALPLLSSHYLLYSKIRVTWMINVTD